MLDEIRRQEEHPEFIEEVKAGRDA